MQVPVFRLHKAKIKIYREPIIGPIREPNICYVTRVGIYARATAKLDGRGKLFSRARAIRKKHHVSAFVLKYAVAATVFVVVVRRQVIKFHTKFGIIRKQ